MTDPLNHSQLTPSASLFQKPTAQTIAQTYRQARFLTGLAILFCATIYAVIYFFSEDKSAGALQARFNTFFQSLLICAWVFFMWPYISVTLKAITYGIQVNEKMEKQLQIFDRIADDIRLMREKVERDTAPIRTKSRPTVDDIDPGIKIPVPSGSGSDGSKPR